MRTRQKKKNSHHDSENRTTSEMLTRSLSHLSRSLRQFSEGLQTRVWTLQERLVVEPLESVAWGVSQRVRKVQNRLFDFIDEKISIIDESRHRKLDHQTAIERFDSEGGSMLPTKVEDSEGPEAAIAPAETTARQKFTFEPSLSH